MQSLCFEDERGIEGAMPEFVSLPGGSCGARNGPRTKLLKSEGATKMAASSIHCIFTGPRGHLEKVLKIRGGHRNGRQLDSLHFFRVPWPPRSERQKHQRASEGLFRKSLKIRGCYEEGRQLISLLFSRVPWPPRVRAARAQNKVDKLVKKRLSELRIKPRESCILM